ncbi:MAG: aryl-sulfate sulfotransferase, partial [Planctomycetota bacterium]
MIHSAPFLVLACLGRFQDGARVAAPAALRASEGYTLFAPMSGGTTYLLDAAGAVAHAWKTDSPAAGFVALLDNGNLLRSARAARNLDLPGGGQAGLLQELDAVGNLVWSFELGGGQYSLHHDVELTPYGTILAIAWDRKTSAEALAAGRDPAGLRGDSFWPDAVLEIEPLPAGGGNVVWEWHAFDHVVQERFPERATHGSVRAHPELIDLNCDLAQDPAPDAAELAEMRATGYVGEERDRRPRPPDWLHTNSIAYDASRDVILLGSRNLSEVWVIDHSTSTAEAAGHTGGRFGRGGDLLARWGNPRNHAGDGERQLFHQHDAHWIPAGL